MLKDLNKKHWLYIILIIIVFVVTIIIYKNINFSKFNFSKFNFSFFNRKKQENWFFKQLHTGDALNKINGLIVEANGEKFTIVNENQNWLVLEKFSYPVPGLKIKEIIFGLEDLKIIESKTAKSQNFAEINLEDLETNKNTTRITLLDANHQKIVSVYLGKREFIASPNSNYQNHIFVRRPEEPQTWLVSGSLPESFAFKDLVKQPLLNINAENITELKLIKAKDPKNFIYIKRSLTKGDLNLLDIPKNYKLKDQYVLDNIVSQFGYLNYEDVIKNQSEAIKVLDINLTLKDLDKLETEPKDKPGFKLDIFKKKNALNFEIVYLHDKYYFRIKDSLNDLDLKEQDYKYWLYYISDYS
ncbi:MAG: DUF4340 domain-containing protein, partial [Gammaproteobacteria bacterium]